MNAPQNQNPQQVAQQRYQAQTLIELGQAYLKLAQHPDTRDAVLKAQKKINPEYRLPHDIEIKTLEKKFEDKFAELERERTTKEVVANQEAAKLALLEKYTPEQVKEIEDTVMTKHGISDYGVAAKVYGADQAPAMPNGQPPTSAGAQWTFPELPGLMDDPAKAARDAAYAMIGEMKRGR